MNKLSFEQLRQIDELQIEYMDALDRKDMKGWLGTFSVDGRYSCKTLESEQNKWTIALIADDCYARLEDRVKFVDQVWVGTFQDYQTRHVVQRLTSAIDTNSVVRMRSNFVVTFTRSDNGKTAVYAAGTYHDVIQLSGEGSRFIEKRAVIDAPVLSHYTVYPV